MVVKWIDSRESEIFEASVENLQIDNQLFDSEKSAVVYITETGQYGTVDDLTSEPHPCMYICWQRMKSNLNANVFKNWEMCVKPLSIILEERLILKLARWIGWSKKMESMEGLQDSDFEVKKALTNATSSTAKRFYFGLLKIVLDQVSCDLIVCCIEFLLLVFIILSLCNNFRSD